MALEAAGFRPHGKEWGHEGVQATFANELTRRRKLYPHEPAGYLNEALAIRAVRQQQIAIQQMEQAAQRQREAERVLQEATRLHLADAPY